MRHFTKNEDLSTAEVQQLIDRAHQMSKLGHNLPLKFRGYQLATLFYEPSTRTRLSFMAAMNALGGSNIGFESSASASVTKGESLSDTIRVVSQYADIIALRHPDVLAPSIALTSTEVPLINAGNGSALHPTQTLADLMTIFENYHRLTNLTLVFTGDLKYGRTIHSLVKELLRFGNNQFIFIAHPDLQIPTELRRQLQLTSCQFLELTTFDQLTSTPDIIYLTRIQTERFTVTPKHIQSYLQAEQFTKLPLGPDTLIMHPLPRGPELPSSYDTRPQAKYFDQVRAGKYMRMALIEMLLTSAH
ncbi:aspartate carbamoyltransferase [Lactiplantibacillus carotarum]|uniref:aspartate carbamoyltransferase n=1 Tax=Lactiplantibacillus carotarum TaxID=2993456 RepID=UPI00298EE5AF|nr:aspartate carbamoyltransferase [Lactiplantibacillus carotarum]